MPISPSPNYASAIDSHEERLQKVESTLQDVVANVAEVSVKQDYAQREAHQSHENLAGKIDEGFGSMKELNSKLFAKLDAHEKDIEILKGRLVPVEAADVEYKAIRAGRAGVIKNIIMGAVLAAAGAVGVKLIGYFIGGM
jgi:hypothetical protein